MDFCTIGKPWVNQLAVNILYIYIIIMEHQTSSNFLLRKNIYIAELTFSLQGF